MDAYVSNMFTKSTVLMGLYKSRTGLSDGQEAMGTAIKLMTLKHRHCRRIDRRRAIERRREIKEI